jgi:hypothetical protein
MEEGKKNTYIHIYTHIEWDLMMPISKTAAFIQRNNLDVD